MKFEEWHKLNGYPPNDGWLRQCWDDAIKAERDNLRELLTKAREVAEWHVCDGDECGTLARIVIGDIDNALRSNM